MSAAALSSAKSKKANSSSYQEPRGQQGRREQSRGTGLPYQRLGLPHPWTVLTQHDQRLAAMKAETAALDRASVERERQLEELAGIVEAVQIKQGADKQAGDGRVNDLNSRVQSVGEKNAEYADTLQTLKQGLEDATQRIEKLESKGQGGKAKGNKN